MRQIQRPATLRRLRGANLPVTFWLDLTIEDRGESHRLADVVFNQCEIRRDSSFAHGFKVAVPFHLVDFQRIGSLIQPEVGELGGELGLKVGLQVEVVELGISTDLDGLWQVLNLPWKLFQ